MPNRKNGRHWGKTNGVKGKAYDDAYMLTYEAMQRGAWANVTGRVPVVLTFHAPDKRHRDLDNLLAASKAALDGVAAALHMDDREFEPVTLKRGPVAKHGALVVQVGGEV
jgi:crossover junction endodeoxyribonuclease RusA